MEEEAMPIYITRGRYTREAIKGMIVKPEDRYESLSRHVARTGGRVLSYFMTFGDFLTVIEAPGETQMQPCCGSFRRYQRSAHLFGDDLNRSQGCLCGSKRLGRRPTARRAGPKFSPILRAITASKISGKGLMPVLRRVASIRRFRHTER